MMIKNLADKIIRYEEGLMTREEVVVLFQELVDTGLAWSLQGSYARMAHTLIDMGEITPPTDINLGKNECE